MAKKAFVYDGSAWVDLASSTTDLSNYYTKAQADAITPPGNWTTFTPNIVNFGVGTGGTSTGAYVLVGKTLHLRMQATLGTGFNVSGALTFNLPNSFSLKSPNVFTYYILDNLSAVYVGLAWAIGGNSISLQVANASGTYLGFTAISGSVPMTWAAGDSISLWLTTEVN